MTQLQRKNVFISYSHSDTEWLKRLQIHLKPLEQEGAIELWSDEKIQPGSQWREEIRGALEQARVAVLLVSANFLASEFIVKNELPPLLDAAKKENAVILPVIVSPCRFKKTKSLSEFQAINTPEKTLLQMSEAEREEVFVKVADAIENALQRGNEPLKNTTQNSGELREKEGMHSSFEQTQDSPHVNETKPGYPPVQKTQTKQSEDTIRKDENKKGDEQQPDTGRQLQSTTKNKSRLLWLLPGIIIPFVVGGVIAILLWPKKESPVVVVSPVAEVSDEARKPSVQKPVKSDLLHISGDYVDMGSSEGEDEYIHQVYVNDFYIGKNEVTVGEFREFMREADHRTDAEKGSGAYVYDGTEWKQRGDANWLNPFFKQSDKHPVVCVSWNDAIAYCNWRSQKEGVTPVYTIGDNTVSANFNATGYRLPTEAEWEYAARSGKKGNKYSWGDGEPHGKRGGNIADEALKRALPKWPWEIWKGYDDGYVYTAPVGSFEPNEFGLYDMTGNVWEWCWDWYDKDYYKNSPKRNPQGPSSGNSRVVRGGAWFNLPDNVRAANRTDLTPPDDSYNFIGFRLSRTF